MSSWEEDVKRLKANDPRLTTLELSNNSIGDDGAKAIAEALKDNTFLTSLNLGDNSIGDDGAKAIAVALKDNTVLNKLILCRNSMGAYLLNDIQKLVDANKNRKTTTANTTDLISKGRFKMKEAMDNVNSRPIELPVEFINSCTNNFDEDGKLGEGAFAVVYKGKDGNQYFAVKRIRFNIAVEKNKVKEVTKGFKRELQALKRFRHPNIVTLYGYHLSSGSPNQYLVFEYASEGSLDKFYETEQSRATLSSEIRLRIMFDIICAIHYLHAGTENNLGLFHRNIKSANICLDQYYTAKLIDCGLAKFVLVDDFDETSANSFSVQITSNGGVFGSRGYMCPWYSRGGKKFEASCDVYSFGIVMIELVTGCLQNDKTRLGDFYERYFPDEFEGNIDEAVELAILKLVEDVDPLAKEWDNGILASVCPLAIRCIQIDRLKRPTTSDLVEDLKS